VNNGKTEWIALIGSNTTDNFGNTLKPGYSYLPVILSASKALEENLSQFINALSDMAHTTIFPAEKMISLN